MKAVEFYLWGEYRAKYGFAADRQEWATANGAAVVASTWGGKVKASEIVPQFGRVSPNRKATLYKFACLPGAVVTFTPKDPSKPTLTGAAALREIDRLDEKQPIKLLDGKKPNREPAEKRTTLGGD